ncbi:putative orphan protein [Leptospira johnsonii]|jgi:hypothetical protein|uniref:Putative orphan protein n=1 Tax=Leptospira johnsonii TaxID=1917820 RepID=A0A2P2D7Q7_9LEPT|nr:putative orphan protein [Leptospira johnsonii]
MKYTKEIPVKPGWYWRRNPDMPRLRRIVEVERHQGQYCAMINGLPFLLEKGFEYAGPIEEPEE